MRWLPLMSKWVARSMCPIRPPPTGGWYPPIRPSPLKSIWVVCSICDSMPGPPIRPSPFKSIPIFSSNFLVMKSRLWVNEPAHSLLVLDTSLTHVSCLCRSNEMRNSNRWPISNKNHKTNRLTCVCFGPRGDLYAVRCGENEMENENMRNLPNWGNRSHHDHGWLWYSIDG